MLPSALNVLRQALSENPRLQLASGVSALGAIIAITLYFVGGDRELAIIGGLFVIGFMFMLAIFVSVTQSDGTVSRPVLANFLIWSVSILFIFAIAFVFSSCFFCWPQPFGRTCSIPRLVIENPQLLNEKYARRDQTDKYIFLEKVEARVGHDFFLDSIEDKIFVVAAAIKDFSIDKNNKSKIVVTIEIYADGNLVDIKQSNYYTSPTAWRSSPFKVPSKIGLEEFLKQFNEAGYSVGDRQIPFVFAISCISDRGRPPKNIEFNIIARDEQNGTFATISSPLKAFLQSRKFSESSGTDFCTTRL